MTYPTRPLPFFPLPDLVFFPGAVQPLQIFEPRYLQMIEDLLDSTGELVIGTLLGKARDDPSGTPEAQPMASLCVLQDYQRLLDQRFLILVQAKARGLVTELDSDRLYRQVLIDIVNENQAIENEQLYRAELESAILDRTQEEIVIPEQITTAQLTDMLLLQLDLPSESLYRIYATAPLAERIQTTLETHAAPETEA